MAPVEACVPFATAAFVGSGGLRHLIYELRVTSIYGDIGPLRHHGEDKAGARACGFPKIIKFNRYAAR